MDKIWNRMGMESRLTDIEPEECVDTPHVHEGRISMAELDSGEYDVTGGAATSYVQMWVNYSFGGIDEYWSLSQLRLRIPIPSVQRCSFRYMLARGLS